MEKIYPAIKFALGFLALSLVSSVASAEDATPKERKPSKATLQKYDADKDGQLSDEERARAKEGAREKAKHTREENLAKYDANHDGKLDESERATKKADEEAAKEARRAEKQAGKGAENKEAK